MMAQGCNSSTWRLRQEEHDFVASLGYKVKPSPKRKKYRANIVSTQLKNLLTFIFRGLW
jgi:hypothetical protein